MTANDDFTFISNNQKGMDLLFDNYILKYVRPNKDGTKYYKCRHHLTNDLNEQTPCPASATLLNETVVVRANKLYNHPPLSHVHLESMKAMRKEKELAVTSRRPLSQIHTEVQSQLVQSLTKEIDKTNITEIDAVLDV